MSGDVTDSPATEPVRPLLRVVRGDPTAAELAALSAVVAALAVPRPAPRRARPEWASPARALARTSVQRLGGWRASALPR